MPNIMEAIKGMFNTVIDDEAKPPLNIIEASFCWTYFSLVTEALSFEQLSKNTTTDDELLGILEDGMKLCKNQSKKLKEFMIKEGVSIPPITEDKPKSNSIDIPPGVKLSNTEISNGLALKIISMSIQAATAASQSVRTDIGAIWVEFLIESLTFGSTLKTKMRKRGWAKIPPDYNPPGSPTK
ncbi:DUF3231 family protein [Sporosalibacterium faouarense]|uniref:DUF3231 family protein n=1 Tax=Sporosalibacterium faouarense TaxID=516123 RepID=UPI00141C9A8F|nr:DUF3231 family protein [Sporosalibacterium faouarense]MTI47842.1 DUF3231 family protein [Bacillota bacterium]